MTSFASLSLRWRLVAIMCLVYILVALTTLAVSYSAQEQNLHKQMVSRAKADARILAAGATAPLEAGVAQSRTTLQDFVQSLDDAQGVSQARVIGAYGTILASTNPAELGSSTGLRPDQVPPTPTATWLRNGDVEGRAPVDQGTMLGVAEVILSGRSVQQELQFSLLLESLVRVLGMILFLLLSLFIAQYLVAPLTRLVRAAEMIKGGKLDTRVPVVEGAELASVAEAFNDMAAALQQRITNLRFLSDAGAMLPNTYRQNGDIKPILAEFCLQLGLSGVAIIPKDSSNPGLSYSAVADTRWYDMLATRAREVTLPTDLADSGIVGLAVPLLGDAVFLAAREGTELVSSEERQVILNFAHLIGISADNARLLEEQREALQVKDQFLSIVSHELRTPITTIKGYAQILMRKFADDAQISRFAGNIEAQASRLSRLVDDLLDVTRFSRGQFELMPQPMEVQSLLREVVARFRLVAPRHTIQLECDDIPLEGVWDRDRLEQVLNNLIGNAIKYSPEGGTVWVTARPEGESLVIAVRDQGIGIPPEQQTHLFERFFRADQSGHDIKGLGLGLYVTRRIVEAHGGQVSVKSEPGQGSEFRFTLPLTPLRVPS